MICTNCNKEYTRDLSIFCPFCGKYIPINGGNFSKWQDFDFSFSSPVLNITSNDIGSDKLVDLEEKIEDVYMVGDIIACKMEKKIIGRNTNYTNSNIWEINDDQIKNLCICRPFLFYANKESLYWMHLGKGENKLVFNLDQHFPEVDSSKLILHSFEKFVNGIRRLFLIIIHHSKILIFEINEKLKLIEKLNRQLNISSEIKFINIDQNDNLFIISNKGEIYELSLDYVLKEEKIKNINVKSDKKLSIPQGSELEWIIICENEKYFALRDANNKTAFYSKCEFKYQSELRFKSDHTELIKYEFDDTLLKNQQPLYSIEDKSIYVLAAGNHIYRINLIKKEINKLRPLFQQELNYRHEDLNLQFKSFYELSDKYIGLLPRQMHENNSRQMWSLCLIKFDYSSYSFTPIRNVYIDDTKNNLVNMNLPTMYANKKIISKYERGVIIHTIR